MTCAPVTVFFPSVLGQSNQRCFRRKRHHVKDELRGANQILRKSELIGFSAARHSNRRNVDEQSRFFRCELICPPKAVLLGKRGSRRLISRKDQAIGQSRVPQRAGDSFRHAAAALENEIDMRRNFTRFQELINGRVVCVVSSQVSVRVDDGIHGHDALRRGIQFVQVLNTCLLERHGYRAAPDSQRTDSANRGGKISGGKSLVDKVQAQLAVEEVVESRPEVSRPRRERHAELGVFVDVAFHWRAVGVVSPSSCLFKALARTVSKLRRNPRGRKSVCQAIREPIVPPFRVWNQLPNASRPLRGRRLFDGRSRKGLAPPVRQRLSAKLSDEGSYEQRCCSHAFARAPFGTFGMTSPLCLLIVLSSTQISAWA